MPICLDLVSISQTREGAASAGHEYLIPLAWRHNWPKESRDWKKTGVRRANPASERDRRIDGRNEISNRTKTFREQRPSLAAGTLITVLAHSRARSIPSAPYL